MGPLLIKRGQQTPMNHLPTRSALLMTAIVWGALAIAQVPPQAERTASPEESRGGLLYTTHCIACHTTQMHWRVNRSAYDWQSLQLQVRRWQGNAGLQWGDADISEVSRYLNDAIYQYPQTANRVGLLTQRPSPDPLPGRQSR
jgi:mono/diheme cytochrome c family protein